MKTWYVAKVNFLRFLPGDENKTKSVTEDFLIDAESFGDAETQVNKHMDELIKDKQAYSSFTIKSIQKKEYTSVTAREDLFSDESVWCECKSTMIMLDEDSGKERKTKTTHMIQASSLDNATQTMHDKCGGGNYDDYTITSVTITKITCMVKREVKETA